jgi:hypothetical protein
MKHFGVIKFVNMLAAILFLVMGILLIMSFTLNLSVVDELQQAANFDNWKPFIICAGIVSLLASGVFALCSLKEFQMYSGSQNSVVAEMIYILGVGMELERSSPIGSEPVTATSMSMSRSSSMASIFGFGYDESFKWTFAGRKPLPRDDPAIAGNVEAEEIKEAKEETMKESSSLGYWDI